MEFIKEHSLILVLLAAAVFTFFWLGRFRERLRMGWPAVLGLTVLHVAFGVFCVRAFAFLESGAAADGFSKMSIFGAVFFMPLGYYLGARLTKRSPAAVFDVFTPAMVFTLACSRVNCLISGCCGGVPFFGTGLHWPTREIEIVFYLAFILVLAPRVLRGKTGGEVYPLYMLFYGAVRFLLEFVRVSSSPNLLHLTHLWAFLALTVGLVVFLEQGQRRKRPTANKHGK